MELIRIRAEKNMTIKQLSEISGVSACTISSVERGVRVLTKKIQYKLEHALNVNVEAPWMEGRVDQLTVMETKYKDLKTCYDKLYDKYIALKETMESALRKY